MAVEQKDKSIKIHLDNYIKDVFTAYSAYIKKSLRPKKVPISPGVVFKAEDIPDSPDPRKQKQYRSALVTKHPFGRASRGSFTCRRLGVRPFPLRR